jgi:dTDP-4-amino-4,6-dideoxygalactose transaminase
MELIARSLRLRENDEILMAAYNLIDLPRIIQNLGYRVKFVDVDENSFNLNPKKLSNAFSSKSKPRVIVATHLFGFPCEMDKILSTAKRKKLFVVEDCTHSLGALFGKKKVGSMGDAGFFSFEVMKPLNALGGGMITTNNDALAEKIRRQLRGRKFSIRNLLYKIILTYVEDFILNSILYSVAAAFLRSKKYGKFAQSFYQGKHKAHRVSNSKFTNFQALIASTQLKRIDAGNESRMRKAALYKRLLSGNKEIKLPLQDKKRKHIFYNFLARVEDAEFFSEELFKFGIDAPFGADIMQSCVDDNIEEYPATASIECTALKLPLDNKISAAEVSHVAKSLKKVLSSRS